MGTEIQVDGKTYVSSKRAAEITGYAQDYIGQLARKGSLDARKVGGLWYVTMDSLNNHEDVASAYDPAPPVVSHKSTATDTVVSFDGKEYISSNRAAEMSGYSQDYVGQLAREGKVPSRQIGSRWYVAKGELLAHKEYNDALLSAVQAQSVGLSKESEEKVGVHKTKDAPVMQYFSEESAHLMPKIAPKALQSSYVEEKELHTVASNSVPDQDLAPVHGSAWNPVPIRKHSHALTRYWSSDGSHNTDIRHHRHKYRNLMIAAALSIAFPSIFVISSIDLNLLGSAERLASANSATKAQEYLTAKGTEFTAAAAAGDSLGGTIEQFIQEFLSAHVHFERN